MHYHLSHFETVMAGLVAVFATARLTRLIVFDTYPPVAWLRMTWHRLVGDGEWGKLVECQYCAAPYIAVIVLGIGAIWSFPVWWWVPCIWLSCSYAASIIVAFDGDNS